MRGGGARGPARGAGVKGDGRRGRLRPGPGQPAARTPFVLLVVVLLGTGLISLLLLNTSLNQGSFKLSKLRKQTTELTDEQQALQQEVDSYSAPDALERRARELGLVPGGPPAFLTPDGTVRGAAAPADGAGLPPLEPASAPPSAARPSSPPPSRGGEPSPAAA
ncbi:FtsB family cell division protein, partial [Streptomyces sp. URMC 123]|uniref:FtsB family cell division protein n=1 Tax=Streptomyces sp. URMC 123 TaxID=3423403 RepID=UPI003F1C5B8A